MKRYRCIPCRFHRKNSQQICNQRNDGSRNVDLIRQQNPD
jgi:hypothetical protein